MAPCVGRFALDRVNSVRKLITMTTTERCWCGRLVVPCPAGCLNGRGCERCDGDGSIEVEAPGEMLVRNHDGRAVYRAEAKTVETPALSMAEAIENLRAGVRS